MAGVTQCMQCGVDVPSPRVFGEGHNMAQHLHQVCAPRITRELYRRQMRPYPTTHTLPADALPHVKAISCGRYDGEPRAELPLATTSCPQVWFPLWVDIVATCWSRHIWGLDGADDAVSAQRMTQRNTVLTSILLPAPPLQQALEAAWRAGDYPGALAYLKAITPHGWPPPRYLPPVG